jgi:hypothetical protein
MLRAGNEFPENDRTQYDVDEAECGLPQGTEVLANKAPL